MTTRVVARLLALRRFIVPAALAVAAVAASPSANAQFGGGVEVTINRPGGYGRVVLAGLPPPPLIFPRPVTVQYVPVGWHARPLYLRVPPHHARHWHYYCHRYHACNRHVIFVRDSWGHDRHWNAHGHRHHHHHAYPPRPGYRWHDSHYGRGHDDWKRRHHRM